MEWLIVAAIGIVSAIGGAALFLIGILLWAAYLEARSPIDADGER